MNNRQSLQNKSVTQPLLEQQPTFGISQSQSKQTRRRNKRQRRSESQLGVTNKRINELSESNESEAYSQIDDSGSAKRYDSISKQSSLYMMGNPSNSQITGTRIRNQNTERPRTSQTQLRNIESPNPYYTTTSYQPPMVIPEIPLPQKKECQNQPTKTSLFQQHKQKAHDKTPIPFALQKKPQHGSSVILSDNSNDEGDQYDPDMDDKEKQKQARKQGMDIEHYVGQLNNMVREEIHNKTDKIIDFNGQMQSFKKRTEKNLPFTMTQVADTIFIDQFFVVTLEYHCYQDETRYQNLIPTDETDESGEFSGKIQENVLGTQ